MPANFDDDVILWGVQVFVYENLQRYSFTNTSLSLFRIVSLDSSRAEETHSGLFQFFTWKKGEKKNTVASWTNTSCQGRATWVKGLCQECTLSSVAGGRRRESGGSQEGVRRGGAGGGVAGGKKIGQTARRLVGQHSEDVWGLNAGFTRIR